MGFSYNFTNDMCSGCSSGCVDCVLLDVLVPVAEDREKHGHVHHSRFEERRVAGAVRVQLEIVARAQQHERDPFSCLAVNDADVEVR